MFRILIVEDFEDARVQLQKFITEAMRESDGSPGVKVFTAETVPEATQMIEEARKPYHAVVLDFLLPPQLGHPPEADESICLLIRQRKLPTLVAHITAYGDDPLVKSHLERVHQQQVDPRSFALSKFGKDGDEDEDDFEIRLIRKLKAYLFGKRIEEQIRIIFGDPQQLSFASRARDPQPVSSTERSRTHDMAALRRDIIAYWHDLDEELKDDIRQIFHVDDSAESIRISRIQPSEHNQITTSQ